VRWQASAPHELLLGLVVAAVVVVPGRDIGPSGPARRAVLLCAGAYAFLLTLDCRDRRRCPWPQAPIAGELESTGKPRQQFRGRCSVRVRACVCAHEQWTGREENVEGRAENDPADWAILKGGSQRTAAAAERGLPQEAQRRRGREDGTLGTSHELRTCGQSPIMQPVRRALVRRRPGPTTAQPPWIQVPGPPRTAERRAGACPNVPV